MGLKQITVQTHIDGSESNEVNAPIESLCEARIASYMPLEESLTALDVQSRVAPMYAVSTVITSLRHLTKIGVLERHFSHGESVRWSKS